MRVAGFVVGDAPFADRLLARCEGQNGVRRQVGGKFESVQGSAGIAPGNADKVVAGVGHERQGAAAQTALGIGQGAVK